MQAKALLLLACLLGSPAGTLAAEAEHSHGGAPKPKDMGAMWQVSLARKPVSVSSAFDREGRLWLARVENGHVLLSHSTDLGKTFSTALKVNSEAEIIAADGENRPKLAFGPGGEIYVSWTRSLDKPFSGHVRFARSADGGQHFSAPVTVNDNLEIISHRFETLGVDSTGRIHLAWLDKRDLAAAERKGERYTGNGVYYTFSDDGGKTFAANRKLADHSCECCRVAMAMEPGGVPVLFWRHIYGQNTRDFALARITDDTVPVRATHDNWQVDGCPHHGGAISIGPDLAYHLVWFNNGPERHGLFYGSSRDRGQTFSAPLGFGDEDAQAGHPDVLSLGQKVFIVWKEFDGKVASIQAMQSSDGGSTWSSPRRLATSGGASDHPLLIARQGKVYLSWQSEKEGLRILEIGQP